MTEQPQITFFDPTPDRAYPQFPLPPTREEVNASLDSSPLMEIVIGDANKGPFNLLRTAAFEALQRYNHSPRGQRFGVYGQTDSGKTYIMRKYAETLGIPYVHIQSACLDSTWSLFEVLRDEFEKCGTPLVPDGTPNKYTLPPAIVTFDEAHTLPRKLMMGGGLLCPMDRNDGILRTRPPGEQNTALVTVDCRNLGWACMTNDRGLLFDAFKNRWK